MPNEPNSEILTASEFAVKAAKKELNKTLDYSIDSFEDLEAFIQHVKSHFKKSKNEGKLMEQTVQRASISIGGYLGEVIRRQIGGTWIAKNPIMKVLVINGEEFSPILYVFERLTKDLDFSLQRYYSDVNNKRWVTISRAGQEQKQTSYSPSTNQKLQPQENIRDKFPAGEMSNNLVDKVDVSKFSISWSHVVTYFAVGIMVILLVIGMASPDYGSVICGGVILLAVGYAIWVFSSSNKQRNVIMSKAVQEQKQTIHKSSVNTKTDTHITQNQTNTVTCRSCGQVVARTAPVCPSCGDTYPGLIDKCPTCGSKDIRIMPKGFSLGKAAAGVVIAGPLGLAGGLHGKNDLQVTCSSCHNTFTIKSNEI